MNNPNGKGKFNVTLKTPVKQNPGDVETVLEKGANIINGENGNTPVPEAVLGEHSDTKHGLSINGGKNSDNITKPASNDSYWKRPGTDGINGQLYESKLLALIFFRLRQCQMKHLIDWFKIGSNIDKVGNFDDVLVKYSKNGKEKYMFIQAKHKDNLKGSEITCDAITNNRKGKTQKDQQKEWYNLHTTFKHYLEIRNCFMRAESNESPCDSFFSSNFSDVECQFILYTTANVTLTTEELYDIEQRALEETDLLKTIDSGKINNFGKFTNIIDELVQNSYTQLTSIFKEENKESFNEIAQNFLNTFQIYSSQAKQDKVGQICQQDILECDNTINDRLLFDNFYLFVQKHWMQTGNVLYLTEQCDYFELAKNNITLCCLTQSIVSIINLHSIKFNEKTLSAIRRYKKEQIVTVVSKAPILTTAKLVQEFKKDTSISYCIADVNGKNYYFDVLTAFLKDAQFKILVFICNKTEIFEKIFTSEFKESLNDKKIILVSTEEPHAPTCNVTKDDQNKFSDLSMKCQNEIIKIISKTIDDPLTDQAQHLELLKKSIDTELLHKMLYKEPIEFAPTPSTHTSTFYINRKISRPHVNAKEIITAKSKFCVVHNDQQNIEVNKDVVVISNTRDLFEQICTLKNDRNVHWFKTEADQLVWQQSFNSIHNLDEYIEEEIIDINSIEDIHDRVTILVAEPGMGKTTLSTKLAESSCENRSSKIIHIGLLDHYQQFSKLSRGDVNLQTTLSFLCKTYLGNVADITFEIHENEIKSFSSNLKGLDLLKIGIFSMLYNSGKIIVLVDGFDEIAPKFEKPVLKFLQELKSSKIQKLIITSRNDGSHTTLEEVMLVFAQSLVPFSNVDIMNFFKRRWEVDPVSQKKSKFIKCVSNFLECFSNELIPGNKNFMEVPLHAEMFAVCFEECFKIYGDKFNTLSLAQCIDGKSFDLTTLYKRFFEIKMHILWKEKMRQDPENPFFDIEGSTIQFLEKHKQSVILALLGEEHIELLLPNLDPTKHLHEMVEKHGLICKVINGEPHFVHRSFAEYLAALVLCDRLKTCTESEFKTIYECVFLNNLIKFDRQQICKFLQELIFKHQAEIFDLKPKVSLILENLDLGMLESISFGFLLAIVEASMTNAEISKSVAGFIQAQSKDRHMKMFSVAAKLGYTKLVRAFIGILEPAFLKELYLLFADNPLIDALNNGHIEIAKILFGEFKHDLSWRSVNGSLGSQVLDLSSEVLKALITANMLDCNRTVYYRGFGYHLPLSILLLKKADEDKVLLVKSHTEQTKFNKDFEILLREKYLDIHHTLFSYSQEVNDYVINSGVNVGLDKIALEKVFANIELVKRLPSMIEQGIGFDQSFFKEILESENCKEYVNLKHAQAMEVVSQANSHFFHIIHAITNENSLKEVLKDIPKEHMRSIVNSFEEENKTPLHYAAIYCNAEATAELIKHEARVINRAGKSPIDYEIINCDIPVSTLDREHFELEFCNVPSRYFYFEAGIEVRRSKEKVHKNPIAKAMVSSYTLLHYVVLHLSMPLVSYLLKLMDDDCVEYDMVKPPKDCSVVTEILDSIKRLLTIEYAVEHSDCSIKDLLESYQIQPELISILETILRYMYVNYRKKLSKLQRTQKTTVAQKMTVA